MRRHEHFEWDSKKAEINTKKHKVSFDDAAIVLGDDRGDIYHIEEFDDEHSIGENRYITTGTHPLDRRIILRISWTDRSADDEQVTRIISARPATARERKRYVKEISG